MTKVPETKTLLDKLSGDDLLDDHAWRVIDQNLKQMLLKSAAGLSRKPRRKSAA